VTALLGSPWLAPVLAVTALAAVTAGATLGAAWDRLTAAARRHYAPTGSHRR
jgi:hypothetical protein